MGIVDQPMEVALTEGGAVWTQLASARECGRPVAVTPGPSWIDGIGSQSVLPDMWPLVSKLIDDVVLVKQSEAEVALCRLARDSHLIVEGASAVAFAAALRPRFRHSRVVAILSGGNIDIPTFTRVPQESPPVNPIQPAGS